jgi:hypothetical protein
MLSVLPKKGKKKKRKRKERRRLKRKICGYGFLPQHCTKHTLPYHSAHQLLPNIQMLCEYLSNIFAILQLAVAIYHPDLSSLLQLYP